MGTRALLVVFLCALGGLLSLGWYFYPRGRVLDEHVGNDAQWHPNAEEISREVGPGPDGTFDDPRHLKFAALFKQRYRENGQAIGVKFIMEDRIKAMFAPIIPRWDMAKVAVELQKEARAVFGQDYQVDIYETYITAPMRKLAEVKMAASEAEAPAQVAFDPRFATERPVDLLPKSDLKALLPSIPGIFWPANLVRERRLPQPARSGPAMRSFGPGSLRLAPLGQANTS